MMFKKKKTNEEVKQAPLPVPKPLPPLQEVYEEPEDEYIDEEEVEEENNQKVELDEETAIKYLSSHEQRIQNIEAKLYRLKDIL